MYEGAAMSVRTTCKKTCEFLDTIGLHWGWVLSPNTLRELTSHIQEEVPWWMLLTYETVLVDKLIDEVNEKLERCQ